MEQKLSYDFDNVYSCAIKALKSLGFVIEYQNKSKGIISALTSSSFLSWGENIEVKIDKEGYNSTNIKVKSNAVAQVISWGKNEENEKKILSEIIKFLR